ncbi:FeS cluster assembly protein SufD [Plasmodium gonderi]|uniref:FeS cluster assembly protein SufD n=1 Tax=Plasmodium gonderi TaxID=77519 RepID=A0A1Y1JJ27_PLAGO|nr:FeS cluster assembly protein SufD [Plasmodium gonderi]GAW80812.1 FeS cluster assembly protein SufD [Plasmodium gonderi]
MPKAIIRSYIFVLLLLTNNFVISLYYIECKIFDVIYVNNSSLRLETKPNGNCKLKPKHKKYDFNNLHKRGTNVCYRTGHECNGNKIKRKLYTIQFNNSFKKLFEKHTKLDYAKDRIKCEHFKNHNKSIEGYLHSSPTPNQNGVRRGEYMNEKNSQSPNKKSIKNEKNKGYEKYTKKVQKKVQKEEITKNITHLCGSKNVISSKHKRCWFVRREGTNSAKFLKSLFIYLCAKNRKKKRSRNFKKHLRKYEELYQKFNPQMGEEGEEGEDKEDEISENCERNVSNATINEWYLSNNEKKYNTTLMYDYLSNMHNTEFQDVKSVNNFIKNNELIEKEEWEKKKKNYLTYKYKFKYIHPIKRIEDYYEYKYHIPKLMIYDEDISTEPKFIPSNYKSPKCYNNSPINALTTSGFSARNIDTFGKERNKIYSFNTPNDVKRNMHFNDLMLISSSYNQHFFPNLNFLLNLHTLQILIRDKTAIETDYIIDKFDQLKKKLIQMNDTISKKMQNSLKPLNQFGAEKKALHDTLMENSELKLGIKSSSNDTEGTLTNPVTTNVNDTNPRIEDQNRVENVETQHDRQNQDDTIDEEIARNLTNKKNLFDDQIEKFKEKYSENILEDAEYINLWKYDKNGEIIENVNSIPIPKIYINIDDPKYCMWKILQNSGKSAFAEVPTPNRKLEAWRQQVNLKIFYKQNFDNSISLRKISKEELTDFKMKVVHTTYLKGDVNNIQKKISEENSPNSEDLKKTENLYNTSSCANTEQTQESNEFYKEAKTSDKNTITYNNLTNEDKKSRDNSPNGLKPHTSSSNKKLNDDKQNNFSHINECKNEFKKAFYTLVVRDGIVDEYLSDDITILKSLDNELRQSNAQNTEDGNNHLKSSNNENSEEKNKKTKIFVGSFFNIKDAEIEYLINNELYFIPEHSNWYKKNTQPFVRGQIGKQSRKFDNDYPIYDYRKSDFGMAKFSSLNLASIKDCAVIYLDKNIDLSDKFIHVIFLATSKNEDYQINNKEADYSVYEHAPTNESSQKINKLLPNEKIHNNHMNEEKNSSINNTPHKLSSVNKKEEPILENEKNHYSEKKLTDYIHSPITNPRLVVYIKGNSKINIHESHISLNNNNSGLVNAFSRIYMEEKSNVKHTLSQELGKNVWYFHNVSVKNGLKANYKFVDVLMGSLSSRVNLQIEGENGCKQESYGLSLLQNKQNISQYEMFHHEHPNMETNQLFKVLVSDKGHAVWRSRGRIERNAIKAKLNTLCRSVLLNFGASAVAIPTLEIIPNDIECANHGATISDLEEEPVFSLMTRGITEKIARQMMMKAFVNEILEHIPDENLKLRVYEKVLKFSLKYKKTIIPNLDAQKKNINTP